MKMRSGFVSNSSSCSFVILGVKIEDDELHMLNIEHSEKISLISAAIEYGEDHSEDGQFFNPADDDTLYFGESVARGDECENLYETETSFSDLSKKSEKILKDLKKVLKKEYQSNKFEVKLYTGTGVC